MKNMFSLVSQYINWSSLSLSTPRMRKTSESCMVSAAHPMVKREAEAEAVQIQLLLLHNESSHYHRPASCAVIGDI